MCSTMPEWLQTEEETKHELLIDKVKKSATLTKKELKKFKVMIQSVQIKTCFHIQEQTKSVPNIVKWMADYSPLPSLFRTSALIYMIAELCKEKLKLVENRHEETKLSFSSTEHTHVVAYVTTLESLFQTLKHKHKMSISFEEMLQ